MTKLALAEMWRLALAEEQLVLHTGHKFLAVHPSSTLEVEWQGLAYLSPLPAWNLLKPIHVQLVQPSGVSRVWVYVGLVARLVAQGRHTGRMRQSTVALELTVQRLVQVLNVEKRPKLWASEQPFAAVHGVFWLPTPA